MNTPEPTDLELVELESSLVANPLDSLWDDVLAHAPVSKAKEREAAKAKLVEAEAATRILYADARNWRRVRGIALIHQETQTCLGNFAEYIHTRVKDCRKLIREEAPLTVEALEYVSGNWWIAAERRPEPAQIWHTHKHVTMKLHLEELGVFAPAVFIKAFLSYGAIARVELAQATRFAQVQGAETFLDLPAGTNIYEVLSRDCKTKLKKELGL